MTIVVVVEHVQPGREKSHKDEIALQRCCTIETCEQEATWARSAKQRCNDQPATASTVKLLNHSQWLLGPLHGAAREPLGWEGGQAQGPT